MVSRRCAFGGDSPTPLTLSIEPPEPLAYDSYGGAEKKEGKADDDCDGFFSDEDKYSAPTLMPVRLIHIGLTSHFIFHVAGGGDRCRHAGQRAQGSRFDAS